MKRFLMILLALLLCAALAEDRPDGSTLPMYRADVPLSVSGWESIQYIESEGLLLSAYSDNADLTISLESGMSMEAALESTGRYGVILSCEGDDTRFTCAYRPKRGTADTIYTLHVYTREEAGQTLVVAMTCWGGDCEGFDDMASLVVITETQSSPKYLALLRSCTGENGTVCAGLDFVSIDYDSSFGGVIFINDEIITNTFRLAQDALVYLPDVDDPLYSMHLCTDADEISRVIREYGGINGQDGLYMVQFDQDNRIIRMQHYNAL